MLKKKLKSKAKKAKRRVTGQRYAEKALAFVAIFLVMFTMAQYVSFLITGVEQEILIERVFTVVGVEIGGLLVKRILEKIFKVKEADSDIVEDDNNDTYSG